MFYTVLIVLFVCVFGFLGWRIMAAPGAAGAAEGDREDTYVCPHCNEHHCDCHKEEEEEKKS